MSETVGDYLLERLSTWGIKRIYGYPGDGINGIIGAFNRSGNGKEPRPEFIQVRHEEMAAFMACAHAKFTGEVGVCMATSGPGAIHLLERPLRRQARPPAGGGDRRPAGPSRAGRQLPAGGRPPDAVQGRRPRVRRDGDGPGPDPPSGRPRHAGSRWPSAPSPRSSSPTTSRTPRRWRSRRTSTARCTRVRLPAAPGAARRRGPRPGRRGAERREQGGHAGRPGRAARRRRGRRRSPRGSAPAWPRRCSARPRCPTTCRT